MQLELQKRLNLRLCTLYNGIIELDQFQDKNRTVLMQDSDRFMNLPNQLKLTSKLTNQRPWILNQNTSNLIRLIQVWFEKFEKFGFKSQP